MGNIRNTRISRPNTALLSPESRARLARQIAEMSGVVVVCQGVLAAPEARS